MFRVLQEAKKNSPSVLRPRNNRRRPENKQNIGYFLKNPPKQDEYPSLSEEKVPSKTEVTNSYAEILRKGIRK